MEKNSHFELAREIVGFDKQPGEFRIRIESEFESAHYLYRYFADGTDEPVHGHSWLVYVYLKRANGGIGIDGISYDFLHARQRLDMLTERIDHCLINELIEFKGVNPTAENIARWFYYGLIGTVEKDDAIIEKVQVFEGPKNMAEFFPGKNCNS